MSLKRVDSNDKIKQVDNIDPEINDCLEEGPQSSIPRAKRPRRNAIKPNSAEAKENRTIAINYLTETIVNDISTVSVNSEYINENPPIPPPGM